MKDNKYLISMRGKLLFTEKMIYVRQAVDCSSLIEDEVYEKLQHHLKRIDHHLSSNEIDNNKDYKLYMECKELISYWN